MKTKINYRSKKTIIIVAIIVALLVVASIGTVVFIKGNRRAAAATEEQLNPAEGSIQTTAPNADESVSNGNLPLLGETDENNNNNNAAQNDNANTATANGNNANNAANNANNTNNANTNTNVPNQQYTQTTVEITERPWETSETSWEQITKNAELGASINELEINKPNLTINKYAYMESDETKKNSAIQIGEKITYVIEVENLSETDANNIYVYDTVPAGTELVEDPSKTELSWKIDVPAKDKVEISFEVKVTEVKEDGIKNIATVNGEKTNPTETAIIDSNKKAEVIDSNGNIVNRAAKVGEKIKYTITANNKTSVNGKTTIIDTVPEGTELVEDSVSQGSTVTVEDGVTTIKWENVDVEGNSSQNVSFEVIVKDTSKSIKNIATIGNTKTEETETKVANIKTVKTSSSSDVTIHENDEIVYTLTLTNSGNAEGTVEVSDIVPEGTRLVKAEDAAQSTDETTGRTKLTWNVTVPAEDNRTVTFKVKVNPFNGTQTKTIVNDQVKQDGESVDTETENKVEKEYLSIVVNKQFEDSNNTDGVRPTAVTIGLYSNESPETAIETYELKASEGWTYTFTGLDKYGINSKEVLQYTVREISMKDAKAEYTPSVSPENVTAVAGTDNATVVITNTLKPETVKTSITVKKEWENNGISQPQIPDSIKIVINENIEKALYKNKNWTDTFELPKYDQTGKEVEYSVEEENVSRYVQISNVKEDNTITITNAIPSINVVKEIVSINGEDITKSENPTQLSVVEGTVIGYKITVTNGLVDLTNVKVKDEMTNGKPTYQKDENGNKVYIQNGIVDEIEKLPAKAIKEYLVYYDVDAEDVKNVIDNDGKPTEITNTAYAEAKYVDNNDEEQDADTTYSEKSVGVEEIAKLAITKTSDKSNTKVIPGDVINYTITVSNTGNTKQNNVTVTDIMNGGRQATINTSVVIKGENNSERTVTATVDENGVISIGDLEVGETATITATYTVTNEDMSENENTINNAVTIDTDTTGTETTGDTKEDVITKAWIEDIRLNKVSDLNNNSTVKYGDEIPYTLSATNYGTAPGTATLQDSDLQTLIDENKISATVENIVVRDFDENGTARTDSSKTVQNIVDGITVYIPGKESDEIEAKVATVQFTVTVTAKAGQEISNSLATAEEDKPTVVHQAETVVSVKKQTSTPVVTNSNVVIVFDISGSMNDKMPNTTTTRLEAAQDACNQFINGMFKQANSKCQVSVITFSSGGYNQDQDNATCIGTATSADEASNLNGLVNGLEADGGTRIAAGLNEARREIRRLSALKPNNKNTVIVLSDGDLRTGYWDDGFLGFGAGWVYDDRYDEIVASGGETKSRIIQYSEYLKGTSTRNDKNQYPTTNPAPTVYSIPFGAEDNTIMKNIIASNQSTCIESEDNYSDIINAFYKVAEDLQGDPVPTTTTKGRIYLDDIDTSKEVEIRVKDSNGTLKNKLKNTIANISQIKLDNDTESEKNGCYYLDVAEFEASDIIEIDYIAQ